MKTPMVTISTGPEISSMSFAAGLPSPETMSPCSERPDARIFLSIDGGVTAHAALWWRETPVHEGGRIGAIGGFAALDADSTGRLLDAACDALRDAGCRIAVGPMNGNTWRRYRFVVESDGSAPFLLEPENPPEYADWWRAAGFSGLALYSSSRMHLSGVATAPPGLRKRLENSGVTIRGLDPDRYEDELRAIHAVSLRSFAGNFLYTPLDEAAFVQSYQKVRGRVDPQLVLIAERDGIACGFVFAIRDLAADARGEKPAVIVKTLAVDPGSRCAGLGSLLVDQVHQAAEQAGFTEAIHALQHETNTSRKITSRHEGEIFRRYSLFSRNL